MCIMYLVIIFKNVLIKVIFKYVYEFDIFYVYIY